jgi:hypothetical protein
MAHAQSQWNWIQSLIYTKDGNKQFTDLILFVKMATW